MGDEDDGAFVFGDGLEDFVAGGGVEVVGGLVEEEDVGAGGDERGEGETGLSPPERTRAGLKASSPEKRKEPRMERA